MFISIIQTRKSTMTSNSYRQTCGRDIYVYQNFSGNSLPEEKIEEKGETDVNVAELINTPTPIPEKKVNVSKQQRDLDMLVAIKKEDDSRAENNLPHIGVEELVHSLVTIENRFMNANVADLCE